MSRKIDRYMNKHGKPATQCVVQHVRDLDKKLDLSREERSVVLNQCLDKALRDRFYFEEDNKDELEKQEIEEVHESKQKSEEAGFKKAKEIAEQEQEEEDDAHADEQESEEEQSKGQTLSDLIKE